MAESHSVNLATSELNCIFGNIIKFQENQEVNQMLFIERQEKQETFFIAPSARLDRAPHYLETLLRALLQNQRDSIERRVNPEILLSAYDRS